MTVHRASTSGLDLVCADMEASVAFYRRLGVDIPEESIWRTATGAHHISIKMANGFDLSLNSEALTDVFNPRWRERGRGASLVIGFDVESRDSVDATYADLVASGYDGRKEPFDAFWGARYAIVGDPDGNDVGIMSPVDPATRTDPPNL